MYKLRIPRCRECQSCQGCRRALPTIAQGATRVLQPIGLLGFHVRDFLQCPLEVLSVEKAGSGLNVLAARKAICHGRRDELVYGHLIPGRDLGSPLVQIIWYSNAVAHDLSSSILRKNSRGVSTGIPNCAAPVQCRTLCVAMASAAPATASSRRNSSPGSGRTGRTLKWTFVSRSVKQKLSRSRRPMTEESRASPLPACPLPHIPESAVRRSEALRHFRYAARWQKTLRAGNGEPKRSRWYLRQFCTLCAASVACAAPTAVVSFTLKVHRRSACDAKSGDQSRLLSGLLSLLRRRAVVGLQGHIDHILDVARINLIDAVSPQTIHDVPHIRCAGEVTFSR